jgi:hypothetical protein
MTVVLRGSESDPRIGVREVDGRVAELGGVL